MSEISTVGRPQPGKTDQYAYQFGPFCFESEIEIPELAGLAGCGTITVAVRRGEVADGLAGGVGFGRLCEVAATEYLLKIPGVARFFVANGSEVRVQVEEHAPKADVRTYLLGSVFGALCHQNGLLPLHASSVATERGVTAFLGDSGAGKSTLAACLQGRGHQVVSDDICVLEPAGDGEAMQVIPVAGWLKLWRASLDHLGEAPDERHRVYSEDDKYRKYIRTSASERPRLAHVVFLEKATEAGGKPRLEPLPVVETLSRMMRLTYLAYIRELTGGQVQLFRLCARALTGAKGYRLVVPWGLAQMDGVLELVEAELLG